MKPAAFQYYAPTELGDATALLAAMGDDAKVLAGGQSLVPMLNMRLTRFDALVDITRVSDLGSIDIGPAGVRIDAGVRDVEVGQSDAVADAVPLLRLATHHIGHFQIRNRGTLCGSIAHADPSGEYPAVAVALDAEMEVASASGSRRVAAADFFTGTWTTVLEGDELLVATHFPAWAPTARFAVEEVARREGDYAIAGAAVGLDRRDGVITRAAIGLFGLGSRPLRATAAESALVGSPVEDLDLDAVGHLAVEGLDPPADLHASGPLRARIGASVVVTALTRVLADAGGKVST